MFINQFIEAEIVDYFVDKTSVLSLNSKSLKIPRKVPLPLQNIIV